MALVECGLCGWTHEVDEELPEAVIEWKGIEAYAQHALENHPTIAHTDSVVQRYVRTIAAIIAPTNGAMTKHDP